ncbi:MAG TPA: NarK family nitrate/nitrite MFS transporter, partial [Anaeromyxobacteraceae bacterium]|nr:NarK family nitrate/nitrite MFS transporter [Anaeromyxobacteraceae bacterium]
RPRTHAHWDPEDVAFWAMTGRRVAVRNLVISIAALFLAFAVWMAWSVVALRLPAVGFRLTTDQLFWLAALPGLTGATLRIFYSFMVPILGGRRFTVLTTASLVVPAVGMGVAVQDPATPYWVLVLLACLAGLGGGNFASSMTHISYFFPKRLKGTALGLNAGLGNLGVSGVQLVVPLVVGASLFGRPGGAPQVAYEADVTRLVWLQNAAYVWVPLVVLAALAAWLGLDDIASAKASFRDQAVVFRRKHTWLLSSLYFGTFGSFIGFSAGLALLARSEFPDVDLARWAFVGPALGALTRPIGGWLADRLGGARVTLATFAVMIAGALGVVATLPHSSYRGSAPGFLAAFLVLFAASGIGNGSVYRMIPIVFSTLRLRDAGDGADAKAVAQREA